MEPHHRVVQQALTRHGRLVSLNRPSLLRGKADFLFGHRLLAVAPCDHQISAVFPIDARR